MAFIRHLENIFSLLKISQPVAGRRPLAGHRLTGWAEQKSALETGSLRPQQSLIWPCDCGAILSI